MQEIKAVIDYLNNPLSLFLIGSTAIGAIVFSIEMKLNQRAFRHRHAIK